MKHQEPGPTIFTCFPFCIMTPRTFFTDKNLWAREKKRSTFLPKKLLTEKKTIINVTIIYFNIFDRRIDSHYLKLSFELKIRVQCNLKHCSNLYTYR